MAILIRIILINCLSRFGSVVAAPDGVILVLGLLAHCFPVLFFTVMHCVALPCDQGNDGVYKEVKDKEVGSSQHFEIILGVN